MSIFTDISIPYPKRYNKYYHGRDRDTYKMGNNTYNLSKPVMEFPQKIPFMILFNTITIELFFIISNKFF